MWWAGVAGRGRGAWAGRAARGWGDWGGRGGKVPEVHHPCQDQPTVEVGAALYDEQAGINHNFAQVMRT